MHIYAFKVESVAGSATTTTFNEVVDYVMSLPLQKRFHLGIRLETAGTVGGETELHFLKLRETALPGKATVLRPAQSLGLQPDEALSEETAGIFNDKNNLHKIMKSSEKFFVTGSREFDSENLQNQRQPQQATLTA